MWLFRRRYIFQITIVNLRGLFARRLLSGEGGTVFLFPFWVQWSSCVHYLCLTLLLWTKLNQTWVGIVLGWSPFKNCVLQPRHLFKMTVIAKNINFFVFCCFVICQMSSNFNCSYIAMSSSTYIPCYSVKFIFQLICTNYAN